MSADKKKFARRAQAWLELAAQPLTKSDDDPRGVAVNLKWCPLFTADARRLVANGLLRLARNMGGSLHRAPGSRKYAGKRMSVLYPTTAGLEELATLRRRQGAMTFQEAARIVHDGHISRG